MLVVVPGFRVVQVQVSKQPTCPEALKEIAKSVLGVLEWESQTSHLHGAKPYVRQLPPVRNRVCTARETLVRLSARRPQITFSTLLKHFSAFWLLWHVCQGRGISTEELLPILTCDFSASLPPPKSARGMPWVKKFTSSMSCLHASTCRMVLCKQESSVRGRSAF